MCGGWGSPRVGGSPFSHLQRQGLGVMPSLHVSVRMKTARARRRASPGAQARALGTEGGQISGARKGNEVRGGPGGSA